MSAKEQELLWLNIPRHLRAKMIGRWQSNGLLTTASNDNNDTLSVQNTEEIDAADNFNYFLALKKPMQDRILMKAAWHKQKKDNQPSVEEQLAIDAKVWKAMPLPLRTRLLKKWLKREDANPAFSCFGELPTHVQNRMRNRFADIEERTQAAKNPTVDRQVWTSTPVGMKTNLLKRWLNLQSVEEAELNKFSNFYQMPFHVQKRLRNKFSTPKKVQKQAKKEAEPKQQNKQKQNEQTKDSTSPTTCCKCQCHN